MTSVATRRRWLRPTWPGETVVVFGSACALYLLVGVFLLSRDVVFGDALSRTANASYVLSSRNPHLAAIGFVWNPLPSAVQLPLLLLGGVFPGLRTEGYAGIVQSALCMAGAVAVVGLCLRKAEVAPSMRRVAVTLLAVQPMIVLYGANGMSEAMMLLFLCVTALALVDWVRDGAVGSLVAAGVSLGAGYLTRYEFGPVALATTAAVAWVTLRRESGPLRSRLRYAANDAAIVLVPFLVAFAFWAVTSRVVVGEWFPTFSSAYGNSASVGAAQAWIAESTGTGTSALRRLAYTGAQIGVLSPLVVCALVAVAFARRWHQSAVIAPLVVFGAVIVFQAGIFVRAMSYGWLRFEITAIPLGVLLAGLLLGPGRGARRLPAAVTTGLLVTGIVAQAWVFTAAGRSLAREEVPLVEPVLAEPGARRRLKIVDEGLAQDEIAAFLASRRLPEGSVLCDSALAFRVIVKSPDPRIFVISSDLDFAAALARPAEHGVRYVLVRANAPADTVQARWPGLFANGAGFATLERSWRSGDNEWRLYAVERQTAARLAPQP